MLLIRSRIHSERFIHKTGGFLKRKLCSAARLFFETSALGNSNKRALERIEDLYAISEEPALANSSSNLHPSIRMDVVGMFISGLTGGENSGLKVNFP